MGRAPRNEVPGACYHIMHRGNNRENIFETPQDRNVFAGTLRVLLQHYDCMLLAFVVMSNHYHLLIRRLNDPISKFMHQLDVRYAQYFTRVRNRSGHVLDCRYKAYLVHNDRYLLSALRYIHQNPLEAGMVKRVADYYWSSDVYYRKGKTGFVNVDFVLEMLANNRQEAVAKYIKLMDVPLDKEEKNALIHNLHKKPKGSREQATPACLTGANDTVQQQPVSRKRDEKYSFMQMDLDALLRQCCPGKDEYELIRSGCRSRFLKQIKATYARKAREAGYTLQEIGDHISLSPTAVSLLLKTLSV